RDGKESRNIRPHLTPVKKGVSAGCAGRQVRARREPMPALKIPVLRIGQMSCVMPERWPLRVATRAPTMPSARWYRKYDAGYEQLIQATLLLRRGRGVPAGLAGRDDGRLEFEAGRTPPGRGRELCRHHRFARQS